MTLNLWLEQETVWCPLAVYRRLPELYVNRNYQIGVHAQAPGGGHVPQWPIAGDANAYCIYLNIAGKGQRHWHVINKNKSDTQ